MKNKHYNPKINTAVTFIKKSLVLVISIALISSFSGCSKEKSNASENVEVASETKLNESNVSESTIEEKASDPSIEMKRYEVGNLSYLAPSEWFYEEKSGLHYHEADEDVHGVFLGIDYTPNRYTPNVGKTSFELNIVNSYKNELDQVWDNVEFKSTGISQDGDLMIADIEFTSISSEYTKECRIHYVVDNLTGDAYVFCFVIKQGTASAQKSEFVSCYAPIFQSIAICNENRVEESNITTSVDSSPFQMEEPVSFAEENSVYENNDFYEIVEKAKLDSSNGTKVLHKVLAKKDVEIEATVIAYDSEGNVVEKDTNTIILTEGKTNFFSYWFDVDVSDENIMVTFQVTEETNYSGSRDAVRMVKWNSVKRNLYLTVEQIGEVGEYSRYKLLYYKDGKIVGSEGRDYVGSDFNLSGIGSTDVTEIYVYDFDYDDVEFIYEPY